MANSVGNDKTANKVALCSAVFAGFAYVGYSVVRTAFCRKLGQREGEGGYRQEHRLYFRRLSQTTQTDVLLGDLDLSGSKKIALRPFTVQERIRELNLRAKMFTDTVLAIQTNQSPHKSHSVHSARSLTASPWSSPRILSPVDVRHLLGSQSTENLTLIDIDTGVGSSLKRRWVRKSIRQKSPLPPPRAPSPKTLEKLKKTADKVLQEGADVGSVLDQLEHSNRTIDVNEAKTLVYLLHSTKDSVVEKVITTISNLSTFAANQNIFREVGCLSSLTSFLTHRNISVRLAALKALGNLALNADNQREMKDAIPILLSFVYKKQSNEELTHCALLTLSNVAVLNEWHEEFQPILHNLYNLLDTASPKVKVQALKLLINLSCNEEMIPSLLAAQAPKRLIYLLDGKTEDDILLRVVNLLVNLVRTARTYHLDPTLDLPPEEKAASPETMYAAIFGVNTQEKIRDKAFILSHKHSNEEIRAQASKLYDSLTC
ncbi:unnamed protein product [Bemisia tabaci]|uniref:Armadillo repeat-containing domain-containing protein n=1 Tax=Bemisia tabaci TaxID=7038 RepID=A0A9N9ZYS0_BEMTA|nr:unnamed protein product [Bemisia tabaci]